MKLSKNIKDLLAKKNIIELLSYLYRYLNSQRKSTLKLLNT